MLRPFFPELVMSTDLLSFEHPSVLLFCFLLHIQTVDEKRELHIEFWVKKSKVNLPMTFWLHLFSVRISLHFSYFVHRCRTLKERFQKNFRTNCHWSRTVKAAAVRKCLMTLPILVYCAMQGVLLMRFVIYVLRFFVVLEYSLSTVLVFFTFIIPGRRDIVQTVQSDLKSFALLNRAQFWHLCVLLITRLLRGVGRWARKPG